EERAVGAELPVAGEVQDVGARRALAQGFERRVRVEQNLAAGEERRERAYLVAHARRLLVGDAEEQRALELLLRSRQAVAQHARARRVRDLAPLDDVSLP